MNFDGIKKAFRNIEKSTDIAQTIPENCQAFSETQEKQHGTIKYIYRLIAVLLVAAIAIGFMMIWSPWKNNTVYGNDLMEGITSNAVAETTLDPALVQAMADFSVELFQKGQTVSENSLISPLSVYLSLAMTANGAGGDTLKVFEQVLGDGASIGEINACAHSLLSHLSSGEQETLAIYNSVWFDQKRCGKIFSEFLQKNADYYGAGVFQVDFANPAGTVRKINQWVSDTTDGEFEKLLNQVDTKTAVLLLNTILFESKWVSRYDHFERAPFQNADGTCIRTLLMKRTTQYIESETATGFICDYEDTRFRFVALLPNQEISLEEYVSSLTGKAFLETVNLESKDQCLSYLPKFDYEYKTDLSDALEAIGLGDIFGENCVFSNLSNTGKKGNVHISKVEHQTFITVDEEKTRAGAVTTETLPARDSMSNGKVVILNRPFLYAIVDAETKLPVFLGTVNRLAGDAMEAPEYSSYLEEIDGTTYRVTKDFKEYASIVEGAEEIKDLVLDLYQGYRGIPYPITQIEKFAYANHENLEQINFYIVSEKGLCIENGAFSNCANLTKVIFNDRDGFFTTIEEGAFDGSDQVVFYLPSYYITSESQVYVYAITHGIPVKTYEPYS